MFHKLLIQIIQDFTEKRCLGRRKPIYGDFYRIFATKTGIYGSQLNLVVFFQQSHLEIEIKFLALHTRHEKRPQIAWAFAGFIASFRTIYGLLFEESIQCVNGANKLVEFLLKPKYFLRFNFSDYFSLLFWIFCLYLHPGEARQ